jgi:hypothetical protein
MMGQARHMTGLLFHKSTADGKERHDMTAIPHDLQSFDSPESLGQAKLLICGFNFPRYSLIMNKNVLLGQIKLASP